MDIGHFASLRMHGSLDGKVMLEDELQRIYESEINVRISWLWDGGIDVRLGDEMNGYLAEENVASTGDIVPWLQESIAHFYPHSTYAKSLDPQTRERATRRLFRPPSSAAQVRCPDCRASAGMRSVQYPRTGSPRSGDPLQENRYPSGGVSRSGRNAGPA